MPELRPPRSSGEPATHHPSGPAAKDTTTPAAPKLRDSCHNCAASKQRCSKEKPTCARCLKRGRVCEYQQSKRAGRSRAETRVRRAQDSSSKPSGDASFVAVSFVNSHPTPAVPTPTPTITGTPAADAVPSDTTSPPPPTLPSPTGEIINAAGWVPTPIPLDPVFTTTSSSDAGTGPGENQLYFSAHEMQDMLGGGSFESAASVDGEAIADSTDDDPWSFPSMAGLTAGSGLMDADLYSAVFMQPFDDARSPMTDLDDAVIFQAAKTSLPPQPLSLSLFLAQPQPLLQTQPHPQPPASSGIDSSVGLASTAGSSSAPVFFPSGSSSSSARGSCSCMARALSLLQQQLARSPTSCAGSCSSGSGEQHLDQPPPPPAAPPQPGPPPTVQAVLEENERTVEAASGILQCRACAHDRYLLVTLALVIFKLLGWYAAAARDARSGEAAGAAAAAAAAAWMLESGGWHQVECVMAVSDCGGGGGLADGGMHGLAFEEEDEGPGRVVPRLVLSKLYRVKRLVNDLSERLRTPQGGSLLGPGSSSSVASSLASGGRSVSPGAGAVRTSPPLDKELVSATLPAALLGQIELDLQRRLRALSTEVIDMLRRG
ncbi:aflatoxin regulatory protein-domain-containing protein [Staphylotrichum tortipilum]|uniref:Aflatoxin regulatory protein-domain-containing protein n=1 Tax=Staphylotrichum tortipilum TaxID=2831512 RepID=A0AAN6MC63_9PEZI|nr:aflatoxin regulatory protein-domain-containing protein [Staphylotrichum longicolle]